MMLVPEDEIKVCDCGDDGVLTPLIWTFKFPGAEYWCPKCGYTAGMFGAGVNVPLTKELTDSRQRWEHKAKNYLSNTGVYCDWKKKPPKEWEYEQEF